MSDTSLQIDPGSLRSVLKALESLPAELQRSAERAVLRDGAKPILKAARARVGVRSGTLKKSLGVSVNVGKAGSGYGQARMGARNGVKYRYKTGNKTGRKKRAGQAIAAEEVAWYQEMGTPKLPAHPFIRPALDSSAGEVVAAMAAGLDKHLTRVAARLAAKS